MATSEAPTLSITPSLSRSTYSFSEPQPPELSLTVTSNADKPLTVFTWHRPLWPKLALCQRQFIITDLTDNVEVPQTSVQIQRMPFTRVRGSSDNVYFLTIMPRTPTIISTPFGRGTAQPQPKAVAQRGWELDSEGKEMKTRRSVHAHGVDGLEPGHRYRFDIKRVELYGMWWRWGSKEDYLVDPDTQGADRMWSPEHSEQSPLEFAPIESIDFSVEK